MKSQKHVLRFFNAGASVQQLEACEAKLGVKLPWEVCLHPVLADMPVCVN